MRVALGGHHFVTQNGLYPVRVETLELLATKVDYCAAFLPGMGQRATPHRRHPAPFTRCITDRQQG
jgi:hypothetical protein